MNAVVSEMASPLPVTSATAATPSQTEERQLPGRERSWIDAALSAWGAWIWDQRHFEGYPTADAVAAFIGGRGGDSAGHRVLCRDMPPWIRFTHAIWIMLPEHEAIVVWAEFVPGVNEDGRMLSRTQRAQRLMVTEETFRQRLHRARVRIWQWSLRRK